MRRLRYTFVALALLNAVPALAVQPDEMLSNPALETRARTLSKELRCMVCQNQSIDDSDAPLARDIRILVRDRLTAGDSEKQVLEFLTARYGDFVLLKPRFSAETAALWLTPVIVLLAGVCGLLVILRRRRMAGMASGTVSESAPLSAAEHARLTELLGRPEK